MLWALRKSGLLDGVKRDLLQDPEHRSVKYATVIHIIEQCITGDTCNPMLDKTPRIEHVLDNFYVLDAFPEHKRLIKKILQ